MSFHSVCLSVWMSVGHSATYSLPRLINHNQIWSAGIYLSSDPCKPFWIHTSHTFGAERKICKISPISNMSTVKWQPFNAYSCHCERDASCHMTCLSISLSTRQTSPIFLFVASGRGSILFLSLIHISEPTRPY